MKPKKMEKLTKQQKKEVTKRMAKEFLEYRLGIDATDTNVRRLAVHSLQFEKEVERRALKKRKDRTESLMSINQKQVIDEVNACPV